MTVLLLCLLSIVTAALGVWFVAVPALMAAVVIGWAETRRPPKVSQLRRRQLDRIDEAKR